MPFIRGIIASSIVKKILDSFTRTTTAPSLGSATSGQAWTALKGSGWYANGTQAVNTADAASSYPISSIAFSSNATMSADVSEGVGLAFWVTDANNWWAAYPTYTTGINSVCNSGYTTAPTTNPSPPFCSGYTTNSPTCSVPDSCSDSSNVCSTGASTGKAACSSITSTPTIVNTYSCNNPSYPYLYGSTCYVNSSQDPRFSQAATLVSSVTTYYRTFNVLSNQTYSGYTVNTNTTTYSTYVTIVSSVSGTVTTDSTNTVVSNANILNTINSLKVNTLGNTITATAYAGTGLTTQLGAPISRTPASPTRGSSVGIIKGPGGYAQGTTLDNYNATT